MNTYYRKNKIKIFSLYIKNNGRIKGLCENTKLNLIMVEIISIFNSNGFWKWSNYPSRRATVMWTKTHNVSSNCTSLLNVLLLTSILGEGCFYFPPSCTHLRRKKLPVFQLHFFFRPSNHSALYVSV